MRINLAEPNKLFLTWWLFILFMFNLKLVDFYDDLNLKLIFIIILSSVFSVLLSKFLIKKNKKSQISLNQEVLEKKSKLLIGIFLAGTFLTILIDGGLPIFWYISGSIKTYDDYGIPTLQGFLNSILGVLTLIYYNSDKKKFKKRIVILLLFPILIMSRGLFIMLTLELVGFYILTKRLELKNITKLFLVSVSIIYLFGVLGDLRVGESRKAMNLMINEDYVETFEKIPSGFFWTYLYATTSVNNFNFNLKDDSPNYYPKNTLKSIIPSFIQSLIFDDYGKRTYEAERPNEAFNTFTIFTNFYLDFGFIGAIFLMSIILLYFNKTYKLAYISLSSLNSYTFKYAVIFQGIILSIFSDFILILPVIFQILIINFLFKYNLK